MVKVCSLVLSLSLPLLSFEQAVLHSGIYLTSSLKYADKYATLASMEEPAIVVAATIPGNSFPVIEGIYKTDSNGKLVVQRDASGNIVYKKDKKGDDTPRYVSNPKSLLGKACRPGYQSHSVMGKRIFLLFCFVLVFFT